MPFIRHYTGVHRISSLSRWILIASMSIRGPTCALPTDRARSRQHDLAAHGDPAEGAAQGAWQARSARGQSSGLTRQRRPGSRARLASHGARCIARARRRRQPVYASCLAPSQYPLTDRSWKGRRCCPDRVALWRYVFVVHGLL